MSQKTIDATRLIICSFVLADLPAIHRILDHAFGDGTKIDDKTALFERRLWLQWSILNQEWLPKLHQPPYGDRAIILKKTGELIGSVGYAPLLNVFEQIPELREPLTHRVDTTRQSLAYSGSLIQPTGGKVTQRKRPRQ